MPREGDRHHGGRARGGVRPQPPEDVSLRDEAGAQALAQARVHHRAPGDLQPPLHAAAAGAQAPADEVVPGPRPRHARGQLRRERCLGRGHRWEVPAVQILDITTQIFMEQLFIYIYLFYLSK